MNSLVERPDLILCSAPCYQCSPKIVENYCLDYDIERGNKEDSKSEESELSGKLKIVGLVLIALKEILSSLKSTL